MNADEQDLATVLGIRLFEPQTQAIAEARDADLYFYTVFAGQHHLDVPRGDGVFYLDADKQTAYVRRGPAKISSPWIATVIRGYMPENRSSGLTLQATLPYVNGCATRQVFPPERPGDPTWQWLDMPPHSSEQAHHIHSTVRVVYVLRGQGRCVVGMSKKPLIRELYPGQIVILEKMCPHHFETDEERLIVLPLHIFSSVGSQEYAHPMFQGTHLT